MTILTEFSGFVCKKKKISTDCKSDEFMLDPDEDDEDESIVADSESDFDSEEEAPKKTKGRGKNSASASCMKKLPNVLLVDLVDTDTDKDDDNAKKHPRPFNSQKFTKGQKESSKHRS